MMNPAIKVRLIVSDVDGVWTDGRIIYIGENRESKEFHVRDGLAVKLAQRCGLRVALITSRSSRALERRARELGVDALEQGVGDKLAGVKGLLARFHLTFEEIAYIGDDLPDLPVINNAAVSAAPADAAPEVREAARWKLSLGGGEGSFRELVERLLRERGEWDELVESFHGAKISAQSL